MRLTSILTVGSAAVGSDGRVIFASAGIAGAGVVLITCASVGGHPEQRTLLAGHTTSHGVQATWRNGTPRPVSPRFQRCKFRVTEWELTLAGPGNRRCWVRLALTPLGPTPAWPCASTA